MLPTQGQDLTTLLILVPVPDKYDGQETKVCAICLLKILSVNEHRQSSIEYVEMQYSMVYGRIRSPGG